MIKVNTIEEMDGKSYIETSFGEGGTSAGQLLGEMEELLGNVSEAFNACIEDPKDLIDILSEYAKMLNATTKRVVAEVHALVQSEMIQENERDMPVEYDPQIEKDPEEELARKIKEAGEG